MKKRTKIVCTIGPACNTPEKLEAMIRAGMNVARLNFSHGTHDEHAAFITLLRQLSDKTGEPLAILQDLQGPKIRVGNLPADGVPLEQGKVVVFSTDPAAQSPLIPVAYEHLHADVKAGDTILLDDGVLEVKVKGVTGHDIECEVVAGGTLKSHKGINVPGVTLTAEPMTEKDYADVRFGVEQRVDWVALSFVRHAEDILKLRQTIDEHAATKGLTGPAIKIIAKVEKHEAITNIDAIIAAADAIMVARGDLGIETPAEDVPLAQKRIIQKCLLATKPVVVATQMLDSMIRNPRPTRAEVSDIANAVIDHTDAVMLSGETASGAYPVEAVETMARVIIETEASEFDNMPLPTRHAHSLDGEAVSELAGVLATETDAKLILAASETGDTARNVSRYRPEKPIMVATPHERVCRQLNLSWGVAPFVVGASATVDALVEQSIELLKKGKTLKSGDKIVVVSGRTIGVPGNTSSVEIVIVK